MPEPLDFDRIARDLVPGAPSDPVWTLTVEAVAKQFRRIWNARGNADEDAVFAEFRGATAECLRAAGAIRILDR